MSAFVDFEQDIANLVKMGVTSAANRTATYNTADFDGGLVLAADPALSHVPPSVITVSDVDTLKSLCGINDGMLSAEAAAALPIPPAATEVNGPITNPMDPNVCQALSAYVFGNSQTVATWKDTLNQLRFPMQVATFTANTINVQPGNPLILKGTDSQPIALCCDILNIEAGGQIITQGPGKVSSDQMTSDTSASAGVGDSDTPTLVSVGGDGGPGGDGSSTGTGATGAKGSNATEDGKSGCNAAGQGGTGGNAANATDGGPGGVGGDANQINYSTGTLNGTLLVGIIGGSGGKGGNGGSGGNGGPGGAGGDSCRSCGTGSQGKGGNGGNAGNGGLGGNGGNGSTVYINYQSGSPTINTSSKSASGGGGGNAGNPGTGGQGNPTGGNGASASPGNGGKGGQPGKVIINGASSASVSSTSY